MKAINKTIAGLEIAQLGSEVDLPIARMMFFDTYQTLGLATEIMGVTPEGWIAIEQMKKVG